MIRQIPEPSGPSYEFGPFRLDTSEKLLSRDGSFVPLAPKAFDLLTALVRRGGRLVEKEELLREVWPDSFVEESSLSHNIYLLRKALGDGEGDQAFIETVPRRGYRFVSAVRELDDGGADAVLRQRTRARIVIEEEVTDEGARGGREARAVAGEGAALASRRTRPVRKYALASAVLFLAAVAVGYFWPRGAGPGGASFAGRSIAVLPFKTLGAESDNELLGLGMADALILKLGGLGQARVLPTSSVFKYTRREDEALAVGRALGADAVLEGTVQRAGDRVRVTAQLLDLADGRTLWAGKFDERFDDIFAVQDSLSEQLARALALRVEGDDRALLAKRITANTEAYQSYLLGLYFWNRRTAEDLAKAREHLQAATAADPSFARAYAVLADCLLLEAGPRDPDGKLAQAEALAGRALELDATAAEAHTVLAGVRTSRKDFAGAEREHRRALALNPDFATGRVRFGHFLTTSLRLPEGLREMRRAQELDPLSPVTNGALAFMLLLARDYDEAVKYARRGVELGPDLPANLLTLGEAYCQKGMFDEARSVFEKLAERDPLLGRQALTYEAAAAGRREEAARMYAELLRSPDAGRIPAYNHMLLHAALGEQDRAFEWLEKVRPERSTVTSLVYDPQLDGLRSDPRFADFLRRHNLPPAP